MSMTGRNNKCSFSIDHILNVAGNVPQPTNILHYDWLDCTRYRPPRIQRPKKKEGVQRRNAGRNPRIPFSPSQVSILETKFQSTPYLSSHEVQQIATQLQLSEVRVKIWFQNRRARERRDQEPQNQIKLKDNIPKDARFSPVQENQPKAHSTFKSGKFKMSDMEISSICISKNLVKPVSINHEKTDIYKHLARSFKNNNVLR